MMQIPGVVWTACLVGLPLITVWIQDSFPNAIWATPVAGLVLIAYKIIDATRAEKKPQFEAYAGPPPPPPSLTKKILFG